MNTFSVYLVVDFGEVGRRYGGMLSNSSFRKALESNCLNIPMQFPLSGDLVYNIVYTSQYHSILFVGTTELFLYDMVGNEPFPVYHGT